ncbi:hypothetical protein HDU86_003933 [Geranomyces michiganensis]|nr:hypothetical protein HDU86_003933 [Geranomyces michiganensis]
MKWPVDAANVSLGPTNNPVLCAGLGLVTAMLRNDDVLLSYQLQCLPINPTEPPPHWEHRDVQALTTAPGGPALLSASQIRACIAANWPMLGVSDAQRTEGFEGLTLLHPQGAVDLIIAGDLFRAMCSPKSATEAVVLACHFAFVVMHELGHMLMFNEFAWKFIGNWSDFFWVQEASSMTFVPSRPDYRIVHNKQNMTFGEYEVVHYEHPATPQRFVLGLELEAGFYCIERSIGYFDLNEVEGQREVCRVRHGYRMLPNKACPAGVAGAIEKYFTEPGGAYDRSTAWFGAKYEESLGLAGAATAPQRYDNKRLFFCDVIRDTVSLSWALLAESEGPVGARLVCHESWINYRRVQKFWDNFIFPANRQVVATNDSAGIFSDDIRGRVDITRNFVGKELNVEYLYGTFSEFVPATQFQFVARPVKYEIVQFASTCDVASTSVVVSFQDPLTRAVEPLQIDSFTRYIALGQLEQYDAVFRRYPFFLQTANLTGTVLRPTPANVSLALQALLADSICATHDAACVGPNKQYASRADCYEFLTQSVPLGEAWRAGGNNVLCRAIHQQMVPIRPEVHCPHVSRSRGGMCVDSPYADVFEPFFARGWNPMVEG